LNKLLLWLALCALPLHGAQSSTADSNAPSEASDSVPQSAGESAKTTPAPAVSTASIRVGERVVAPLSAPHAGKEAAARAHAANKALETVPGDATLSARVQHQGDSLVVYVGATPIVTLLLSVPSCRSVWQSQSERGLLLWLAVGVIVLQVALDGRLRRAEVPSELSTATDSAS